MTTVLVWAASALLGAAALAMAYAYEEPIVAHETVRWTFRAAFGSFVLSRLLLFLPTSALGARLARWWVDFVLIVAGAAWWVMDPTKERVILSVAAVYVLLLGFGSTVRAAMQPICEGIAQASIGRAARRLILGAAVLCVLGGIVLSLPPCWHGAYPVDPDLGLTSYQIRVHFLRCLFTATAALTCTGLSTTDLGLEFSAVGQVVILALMQIGGLGVLIVGVGIGWRIRHALGWGASDDETSPTGVRRLVRFVVVSAILVELAGAAAMYTMWDASVDTSFDETQHGLAGFDTLPQRVPALKDYRDRLTWLPDAEAEARMLYSAFHAVSALCNCGLALPGDDLMTYRKHWAVYGAILPLMLLGSLGGPVTWELLRRLRRRKGLGLAALSREARVTLGVTLLLIVVPAGLLWGIESTPRWQHRYPRDDTPGRAATLPSDAIATSSTTGNDGARGGEGGMLRGMGAGERVGAAVFQSVAARSGGMQTVRLDVDWLEPQDAAISPASRLVLTGTMLIGGGLGGAAGGLRIVILVLLFGALFRRRPAGDTGTEESKEADTERLDSAVAPAMRRAVARSRSSAVQQAMVTATAILMVFAILIGVTTLVLAYRESASLEECLFEAVSATCNVGFSSGLTRKLTGAGQIAVILAMLLGRVAPLCLLMRYLHNPLADPYRGPVVVQPRETAYPA